MAEETENTTPESEQDTPPVEDAATETPAAAEEETPVAQEETPVAQEETPAAEEAPGPEETPAAEETSPEAPTAEAEAPAPDVPAEAVEEAAATEAEAAPQPAAEPKKKRKRLPRGLRRQRSKPVRERPATRKPITRLAKPESERGRRQERRGVVVSDAMDKTIVVKVDTIKAHPRYKKVVRRSAKFHAHDEQNQAKVGDVVLIVETRPLSKTKNWRLAQVVEAAK
jgi:small subunit ribosomal protein S17